MIKKKRIAVLFGGRSAEHEVSCISARHVVAAMDPDRYEVIPIAITRDGRFLLPEASRKVLEGGTLEIPVDSFKAEGEPLVLTHDPSRKELVTGEAREGYESIGSVDAVFPVLHGPYGEDGTIQGLLELSEIPFVGAGVLGSAIGMDKEKMKLLFSSASLPRAKFVVVWDYEWSQDRDEFIGRVSREVGFPCFTKPANLGSSVGISKCRDEASLKGCIEDAFIYDRKILVEEAIGGRELEVGVLGNDEPQVSVVGEILPAGEFYDYRSKYVDEASRTQIPADLPPAVTEIVRDYALRAFRVIDAQGMARVDFFYEAGGRGVVVNEINTIPGFTTISMFPKLWEASGIGYTELIDRLIELAFDRHSKKRRAEGQL